MSEVPYRMSLLGHSWLGLGLRLGLKLWLEPELGLGLGLSWCRSSYSY